ncbi:MAG: hypothetical protein K0Q95_1006 [Bacteroidota bacterium]|jgi:hypothetical protein|nr:hypothetical protein [Bacteroidota bacterium]
MKRSSFFALFIIILTTSSCTKYGYVNLQYPTAPEVFLPENIHSLAVINRSFKLKEDHTTVIESITSGEIAGSDKKASNECLRGVYDRMSGSHLLNIVVASNVKLYGTGSREMPAMLDWKVVKKICDSTKTDVLLVLETFDSNSDIVAGAVTNQVNAILNGNPPPPPLQQIRMNVISNWRLYDPSSQKIIDQYQTTDHLVFDAGSGALAIPPPEALPKTAYNAGQSYIERFLPGYYTVKRDMYKRGKGSEKKEFLKAFRKSEVANWEGAAKVWEPLTKSRNGTNAGRACLNMAVANEVLGKQQEALEWAKKAYEDYGIKLARDYQNQLKERIRMEY